MTTIPKQFFASLVALALITSGAQADPVRVMAAFTLKNALDEVIQAYKVAGGDDVAPLYGMTPMLAKQVENMAPADVFLSADADWMNYLQDHGLIKNDTRVNLMTADLVLATRSDNAAAPNDAPVSRDFPLLKIIGDGRMAMCNPADHPAGKLGRAGLESLGLWPSVADKVAIAESPPAAVALVVRGEAPVALVFSTDAKGVAGIKVSGVFPDSSHPPIVFPAALLRDSRAPDAARFLAFLASAKAAAVFERYGYRALAGSR
jgi:molybdate transport system substrate-binding protein